VHGVDTATGCDGGAETVVVMAVGAAVLVAAVVVLCLVSGEKSGEGMREIGRAAEAMVGEDGLMCEGWAELWWRGVVHFVAVLAASWLRSRMGLERGLRLRRPTTITLSGVEVKRGGSMIVVMCVCTHACLFVCVCVCVCACVCARAWTHSLQDILSNYQLCQYSHWIHRPAQTTEHTSSTVHATTGSSKQKNNQVS